MVCPHCGQQVPASLEALLEIKRKWKHNEIKWIDAMRQLCASGYSAEQAAQILAST